MKRSEELRETANRKSLKCFSTTCLGCTKA